MIYYLGYYNCEEIEEEKRNAAPPAVNKMGYIISVLSETDGRETVVVSPAETRKNTLVKGRFRKLYDSVSLKTFPSVSSRFLPIRYLGHLLTRVSLNRYLLKNVRREDTVIVYHSLSLMKTVKRLKKKTKCRLIIEAEEIYSDVKENEKLRAKELEYFQTADKFIAITKLLNDEINKSGKPFLISHGTYKVRPKYSEKFSDGKTHVVYAGSFNPVKGGALTAISAAEFLPRGYILHVLGKGSPETTKVVKDAVAAMSAKTECEVVFEGFKSGVEFDSFIQSCHVGLSTQQPDGKYNASSFPSKVLMYMSNGLPVVSVRIPAIATSAVNDCISYYDDVSPACIAQAIQNAASVNCTKTKELLNFLDKEFSEGLASLLE